MLDTDTKRRIDTARDILVGKVPDPKSQVEQITIALIYKFMDDMDAEAEELGGKRKFFAGDFARYGWAKLMRSGLGGHETLNLYGEAIAKMPENPGIPPLFRDIFKNAYLPYRDPETLRAFLKIIDEFTYDHSERLGDAFEYLLSVLGSQGDAGQFRTPRHIIDLIVAIVDPKKTETVLDPACGTAGFLISSYKHILKANTDAEGNITLTPDDKGRLAQNFKGYDISPDMVRLSLVNLYLHGFTDPHIAEYDTLTSQDKWNEHADVILANPPFMSPKGGIKPHNRFSVQSKRSEVLFVDYMAEHLTPSGRAGIIVPQGILSEQKTAQAKLRKMLVDRCGVSAVINLPAGCFRPYADAATAVLVLDRRRREQPIWFFEVQNDGFTLDDRRLPTPGSDIPALLRLWAERSDSSSSFSVAADEVRKHDYSLALDEYKRDHLRLDHATLPTGWTRQEIGKLVREVRETAGHGCDLPVLSVTKHRGFVNASDYFQKRIHSENTSKYKVVRRGQFAYSTIHIDEGAIGYLTHCDAGIVSPMYKVFELVASDSIRPDYLFALLKSEALLARYRTQGRGSIKRRKSVPFERFARTLIPVPPDIVQDEIVQLFRRVRTTEAELGVARSRADAAVRAVLQALTGSERVVENTEK